MLVANAVESGISPSAAYPGLAKSKDWTRGLSQFLAYLEAQVLTTRVLLQGCLAAVHLGSALWSNAAGAASCMMRGRKVVKWRCGWGWGGNLSGTCGWHMRLVHVPVCFLTRLEPATARMDQYRPQAWYL